MEPTDPTWANCCMSWSKPCSYHEGWIDGAEQSEILTRRIVESDFCVAVINGVDGDVDMINRIMKTYTAFRSGLVTNTLRPTHSASARSVGTDQPAVPGESTRRTYTTDELAPP